MQFAVVGRTYAAYGRKRVNIREHSRISAHIREYSRIFAWVLGQYGTTNIRPIFAKIREDSETPITLGCDNQAAINLATIQNIINVQNISSDGISLSARKWRRT
eukprot:3983006-Prymnesium_polylepis.1